MGTAQSMECGGKPRITETANFDFRDSSSTKARWGEVTTTWGQQKTEEQNRSIAYWQDTRSQSSWLEDGVDVARRMEKKEMNIYGGRS